MQKPDSNKTYLNAVSVIAVLVLLPFSVFGGPLAGEILNEGLTVDVEDLIQVPTSSGSAPLARINMLVEVPDGSERLFINDLRGRLYVLDGGVLLTFMDMAVERPLTTTPGKATGFVSIAFHPNFGVNGLFYTVHTEDEGAISPNLGPAIPASLFQHTVLTEWSVSDPAANSFSGTSRELMRIGSTHPFHNLGEIAFKPNAELNDDDYGLLYIAGGDYGNGSAPPHPEQLQRLDTPYGTLMRIDPLGGPFVRDSTTYNYGIPPSNPFASDGDPNTLGEIYAYGFRNAHRIAWDTGGSGTPIVSDIGQGNIEEANILVAGANYGWPEREGTFALDVTTDPETVTALPAGDAMFGFAYPPVQYDHDEGAAIAGGFVYRGPVASDLQGKFVFGDIANGRIFYVDIAEMLAAADGDPSTTTQIYELNLVYAGQAMTLLEILASGRADLRFGMDLSGNLYITTKTDGFIRRLVPRADTSNSAPSSIDLPVISGIAQVGNTLTTTDGTWNDSDGDSLTYSYQWRAAGVNIPGATSSRLTLTANQAQKTVTIVVTANDGNGRITSAESAATSAVVDNTPKSASGSGSVSIVFVLFLIFISAASYILSGSRQKTSGSYS